VDLPCAKVTELLEENIPLPHGGTQRAELSWIFEEEDLIKDSSYLKGRLKKNIPEYLPSHQPMTLDREFWTRSATWLEEARRDENCTVTANIFAMCGIDAKLQSPRDVRDYVWAVGDCPPDLAQQNQVWLFPNRLRTLRVLSRSSPFYFDHTICARGRMYPPGINYQGWYPGRAFLCFFRRPTLAEWYASALPSESSLREIFPKELLHYLPALAPRPDFLDRTHQDSFGAWLAFGPWNLAQGGLKALHLS